MLTKPIHVELTLKPDEILGISLEISRKFAPLIAAKPAGMPKGIALTSREMFDISDEIARKFRPVLKVKTPKLVLLPIDPGHLYASWNLPTPINTTLTPAAAVSGPSYILRIHPEKQSAIPGTPEDKWFDVNLAPGRSWQRITVPQEFKAETYAAAIGVVGQNNRLTVLASAKAAYHQPSAKAVTASKSSSSSKG